MGKSTKQALLYLLLLTLMVYFFMSLSLLSALLLFLLVVRYSYLARLHSAFWIKKEYYLSSRSELTKEWIEKVKEYDIDIDIVTVLSIHKWTEEDFIEDKIFLFEINYYYK